MVDLLQHIGLSRQYASSIFINPFVLLLKRNSIRQFFMQGNINRQFCLFQSLST